MCKSEIKLIEKEYTCVKWGNAVSGKFLEITGEGYNSGYMFPQVRYGKDERVNGCPIVQQLFTEMLFRADLDFGPNSVKGIIVPRSGCFLFWGYRKTLRPQTYESSFSQQDALKIIESMKESKHFAYTLALKLAGEQGWQAMPNDNGNMPCANSMKVNHELRGKPTDYNPNPLTANDNRYVNNVFPQHGLAHGTNYGVTVIPTYGNGISKSLAQYNLFDFLILWRRFFALPGYQLNLGGTIQPPAQDLLVRELNTRQNVPNRGSIYKYSLISVYLTSHRIYGGFPIKDACANRLINIDVHPILCIHGTYKAVLAQKQLCDFAIWLNLPFRPLFMIMIQIWHMKTNKPLGSLPNNWQVLLEVEENKKIFENVFEKEYHIKFPNGSIKASHDCVIKQRLSKCPSVYQRYTLNAVLQSAFSNARLYSNSQWATTNNPNNVIGAVISYAKESVLVAQESILARSERSKYFAYVDPAKHNLHVQKWMEVLDVTRNTQNYINDIVETELYYLIDRLPDPSTDIFQECNMP